MVSLRNVGGRRLLFSICGVLFSFGAVFSEKSWAEVEASLTNPPFDVDPNDADGDGIVDPDDQCPGTEADILVNSHGCEILEERRYEFNLVIHFANNSADIGAEYHQKIRKLAAFIRKYKVKTLTVYGHTSRIGADALNQALSEARALSVKEALVRDYGIAADLIQTVGLGETKPLELDNTEQAHAQNRRIELHIAERLFLPKMK